MQPNVDKIDDAVLALLHLIGCSAIDTMRGRSQPHELISKSIPQVVHPRVRLPLRRVEINGFPTAP